MATNNQANMTMSIISSPPIPVVKTSRKYNGAVATITSKKTKAALSSASSPGYLKKSRGIASATSIDHFF